MREKIEEEERKKSKIVHELKNILRVVERRLLRFCVGTIDLRAARQKRVDRFHMALPRCPGQSRLTSCVRGIDVEDVTTKERRLLLELESCAGTKPLIFRSHVTRCLTLLGDFAENSLLLLFSSLEYLENSDTVATVCRLDELCRGGTLSNFFVVVVMLLLRAFFQRWPAFSQTYVWCLVRITRIGLVVGVVDQEVEVVVDCCRSVVHHQHRRSLLI